MPSQYAAYNAAERAKLLRQLNHAMNIGDRAASKAITPIGYDLEAKLKLSLKGPGKGRVYKKRNPTRIHVASAPGDAPATDTGRLMGSISITKAGDEALSARLRSRYAIGVGTHVKYAPWLEFGTRPRKGNGGIRPRPFFRKAAVAMAASIPALIRAFVAMEAAKLARGEVSSR